MPSPKSSKILIRVGESLFDFMWVQIIPDGSVLMGLRFKGQQQIELVIDPNGELRSPQIVAPRLVSYPKISFHPSGQYKLEVLMGLAPNSIDRSTVIGPRLEEITEPRRMLELLLPQALPVARSAVTERDIVLDASNAPQFPLACTVSCMALAQFHHVMQSDARFVDTSTWELTRALENETHAWAWTLRTSCEHTTYPDRFIVGLLGEVKWGQQTNDGNDRAI